MMHRREIRKSTNPGASATERLIALPPNTATQEGKSWLSKTFMMQSMLSDEMKDLEAQTVMLKLANDYDKLADRADERATRDGIRGPSPIPRVGR